MLYRIAKSLIVAVEFLVIAIVLSQLAPYILTTEKYTSSDEVNPAFPIPVIEAGIPKIINWREYIKSEKTYTSKLLLNPQQENYELSNVERFSLQKTSVTDYKINYKKEDYEFWAEYAVKDGAIVPQYFRLNGIFSVFPVLIFSLFATSGLNWLIRKLVEKHYKRNP